MSVSLLLVVCVVGLGWFFSTGTPTRAAGGAGSGSANWSMFGYNAAHIGYNPLENTLTQSNVSSLVVDWQVTTRAGIFYQPVVVNGIVYVVSDKLYAFNATTGTMIWSVATSAFAPLAVANGVLYLNQGRTLLALNAASGQTIWTYSLHPTDAFNTAPTVAEGLVYIGESFGKLYAFEAASGNRHWIAQTTGGNILSTPAVANGVVYTGSNDKLEAFNGKTGAMIWTFSAINFVATPTVANGMVYIDASASGVAAVYAVNATTGTQVWSFTRNNASFNDGLAVAKNVVYVAAYGGSLYSLDATTGAMHWSTAHNDIEPTAPAVANGVVYTGACLSGGQSCVEAFNARSGAPLWSYVIGRQLFSAPAVVNGMVFVGGLNDNIYAFHLPGLAH